MLRPRFFALHRPLRKQAFDGAAQHEKSAQLTLSAFALVVIRLGFAKVRYFTVKSSALPVVIVGVKTLIQSVMGVFVIARVGGKDVDLA